VLATPPSDSYAPDFLFRPGLFMIYLLAHWATSGDLSRGDVLWTFVLVIVGVALAQTLMLGPRGVMPPFAPARPALARPLRRRALALALVFAVSSAFGDLVTLLGGLYLQAEQVAVLGLAVRLAALAGFVTQAAQQMVLPDLALEMARSPRAAVNRLLLRVNVISLSAIMACVAGAAVLGGLVLGLFGDAYVSGHVALVLFMVSQAFRAASGLNQHLMSIAGFQAKTAIACIFSVAVLVAATSLLAPRYGVNGVAAAVVLADAVWALLLAIQAGRYAGYRGDIVGLLRST
jgi:O-antigen/teichoic acid export membrane protein